MGSSFGGLKTEPIHRAAFPTQEVARRALFEYIKSSTTADGTIRQWLLDPSPSLRADGQGHVIYPSQASTRPRQAHYAAKPESVKSVCILDCVFIPPITGLSWEGCSARH